MSLAGQYLLSPGARTSIVGSRPVMGGARLGHLLRGRQGGGVVQLLGNLLTLCAHAQRRAARMALWSAEHQSPALVSTESTRALELETARDHLRSLALDWPLRCSYTSTNARPTMLRWLAQCPLPLIALAEELQPEQVIKQHGQLRTWLESTLLRTPIAQWRENCSTEDAFAAWCVQAADRATPLQCLARWHTNARSLQPSTRPLDVLNLDASLQTTQLHALAQDLRTDPDFPLLPVWQGACAESGAWTRLRQRRAPETRFSAWSRLQARWLELLELAENPVNEQTRLLDSGALPLGDGQAIAWCEMARGLLLHWVQLDGQQCVVDYRVLAPTEWNFHPKGALSNALSQLSPNDGASAWCLASAYDPCVDCNVNVQEIHQA